MRLHVTVVVGLLVSLEATVVGAQAKAAQTKPPDKKFGAIAARTVAEWVGASCTVMSADEVDLSYRDGQTKHFRLVDAAGGRPHTLLTDGGSLVVDGKVVAKPEGRSAASALGDGKSDSAQALRPPQTAAAVGWARRHNQELLEILQGVVNDQGAVGRYLRLEGEQRLNEYEKSEQRTAVVLALLKSP